MTPAPLSATGVNIGAYAGAPIVASGPGVVATFTNADPFGSAASYSATIDWGDGSTSPGTITGTGTLSVIGSHTYADPVNKTIHVTISHIHGYTTSATTTSTATVSSFGRFLPHNGHDSASIAFWHNNSCQTLINSFNGSSTSTALANWLAASFPNMYGTNAGANNLTGKTNAQVAAFYLTLYSLTNPRLDAEVLATALNVYATTFSLGGNAGVSYGFNVTATGLGALLYNVGTNGDAFGVANNTTLNVYQILRAANAQAVNGVLYNNNATLRSHAYNVFDGINTTGGL